MEKQKTKDTLLLVDANSLIHRAFHALPPLTAPDGRPSGALYGLASILIKVFRERPPEYAAVAFDRPERTEREKEYADYKATRAPAADELVSQIKESYALFGQFGMRHFEEAGWEADDIITTLADRFYKEKDLQTVMLSGDLDILQAVRHSAVVAEIPKKGISNTVVYDERAVRERFGVSPHQLADYKGLVGDTSDNIPGVPGIGPKTAEKILKEYGSLEKLYRDIEEIGMGDEKLRKKLVEHKEQALLSKKLATLRTDIPLETRLPDLKVDAPLEKSALKQYLAKLGFDSLVGRIENAP